MNNITFNGSTEFTTRRLIYRFTIDEVDYEYTEHEDERGKVIDTELFTSDGEFVDDEDIETAIQEYLDSIG